MPMVDATTFRVQSFPHLNSKLESASSIFCSATIHPTAVTMSSPKAPAGHFTLLYFAASTSFTEKGHDFLPAPLLVSQLYDQLDEKYPGIKEKVLLSSAITVNLDYVDLDEESAKGDKGLVIQAGDEVAIIPPVSSG
ncbi:Molybdopterin synthase sulfur carrier subunit [Cercospora zeina]